MKPEQTSKHTSTTGNTKGKSFNQTENENRKNLPIHKESRTLEIVSTWINKNNFS